MTSTTTAETATDAELAQQAVALAASWLRAAKAQETAAERRQGQSLARMMNDAAGKALTFALADQVFCPPGAARSARRFRDLVKAYGVPAYLPWYERLGMAAGVLASRWMPWLVMPVITATMRRQSAAVILPGEDARLVPHLRARRAAGMRMNLNQLGEAILGEGEAAKRLTSILGRLASPDCDYMSIKISAVCSQIHLVGYDETVELVKDRLRQLYRVAMESGRDGKAKFVNLDMEEYRDLPMTCDAFRQVLDEAEFLGLEAGIVLQAYLPDAWPVQQQLTGWARQRVARGGAGIKIRIVKGANLAMEKVDAALHDWPMAAYASKQEVDANFKRMLHEGCRPDNARVVRLGVASHNLFDLAYAKLLCEREGVAGRVDFEMLEGMANQQARVVHATAGGLLLYAPVVKRLDFHSAIAYLVRRLDENTAEENFLHDLFGMVPGDAQWTQQAERFLQACERKDEVHAGPWRSQDRRHESPVAADIHAGFHNAPDTDWALLHNVRWIRELVTAMLGRQQALVPLQIGGESLAGASEASGRDPSRPGVTAYRHALAGPEQVERALQVAVAARAEWAARSPGQRAAILRQAAAVIASQRGEAIATMVLDGGKAVGEADGEVSEAIDFANYAAACVLDPAWGDGSAASPRGTVVVTSPWNFPFAIPCGGIVAALAAGNTVIFKPATETVLTGWTLAQMLWDAGVPKDVLQFVPCRGSDIGRSLVADARVDAVVLTGSYDTARAFVGWKPELRLYAETSGKNAMIITAAADPSAAIKDLVRAAFGHAGQKCSAASLAIIEAERYDSATFRRQLRDAAASLKVGSAWQFDSVITPLIREPGADLLRALTTLEAGEEWLLEPRQDAANPCLWSPGIKLGVQPDGWFRRTECFGPVLGLIRADSLDHAIRIQNDSEFALTAGLHSLDEREVAEWRQRVEAGNAYVCRSITGAIVRRQPFGGWKRSCFGPGAKAGGPNYVAQFSVWQDAGLPQHRLKPGGAAAHMLDSLLRVLPDDAEALRVAAGSDTWWCQEEFSRAQDPTGLFCESNEFRYRAMRRVVLRAAEDMRDGELARVVLAAAALHVKLEVSVAKPRAWLDRGLGLAVVVEDEATLAGRLAAMSQAWEVVVRAPGAGGVLRRAVIECGARLVDAPVVLNGRIELLALLREQSISETLHRLGNVLPKPGQVGRPN